MVLHFNVTKDKRKAMVQVIEKEIGRKAKYLRVPSCAQEIGNFTVGKNGNLEFGDFDDLDEVAPIADACFIVDMFPKRTKVEKTFDMFSRTGKGSRCVSDYE